MNDRIEAGAGGISGPARSGPQRARKRRAATARWSGGPGARARCWCCSTAAPDRGGTGRTISTCCRATIGCWCRICRGSASRRFRRTATMRWRSRRSWRTASTSCWAQDARYDVAGFSFGGTMATCVGAIHGARVRSVTIIGSSGVGPSGSAVELLKVRHLAGRGARGDASHQPEPADDRRSGEDRRPGAGDPGVEHAAFAAEDADAVAQRRAAAMR